MMGLPTAPQIPHLNPTPLPKPQVSLSYLETRGMDVLRRTMLLVDARHGVKPQDEEVMAAFDARAVPYQVRKEGDMDG